MIEKFNIVPAKERGKVYDYQFKVVKELYNKNPQMARELAIAIIEKTLTGQSSNNDSLINALTEALMKEKKV